MSLGNVSKSTFNTLKCGPWSTTFCELSEDNSHSVNTSATIKTDQWSRSLKDPGAGILFFFLRKRGELLQSRTTLPYTKGPNSKNPKVVS